MHGSVEGAEPRRRWVPPSSLRRNQPAQDDADAVFRRVRGILNKLTPENFRKLSDDLLALDLASPTVLKGVILLVFEKALDEPKYSSMYAQLCKRLSEEAPNLEPPGQPCTFRLLLLNKCRAEFENRTQAFAAFEGRPLAPEEEERRHLAKRKMLGNIKFIGELGKLEILAESILHRCIQNLLTRRAAAETHEDLECLAQLVKTCGRVLDSERGRGLMEQYFERIQTLARSRTLAPRIRFMLRDVLELRRGGWVPRAATQLEGPVPIHQLHDDFRAPPRPARARPLPDVLAGLSLSSPLALPPRAPAARPRPAPAAPAPRNKRLAAAAPLDEVQMRPAANSLLFTANKLSRQPAVAPSTQTPVLTPSFSPAPLMKDSSPTITIKPAQEKNSKPKRDKGLTKEEVCRLAMEAATAELAAQPDAAPDAPAADTEQLTKLRDLQPPDKLLRRAIAALVEHALSAEGAPAARAALAVVRAVKRAPVLDILRAALQSKPGPPPPRALALAVLQRLLTLAEAAALCEAGSALLDVLQRLTELAGLERARTLLADSKLRLGAGDADVEAEPGWAEAAEARGLGALLPGLRVHAELARALASQPAPASLYRWIKTNVEPAVRHEAGFVSALVALLAQHVTAEAGSGVAGADKAALERERALLETYAPLLRALLAARPDSQLAAVYAVQLHAHRRRYPKGLLLRWFMLLYSLEVCEEEAFLRWREDVTDAYPGKGEALFQVNTWLTWLQQQDSEDEDADD